MDQVSMTSAYMLAFVVMAVLFAVAVVASNLVLYKPGNPGTTTRRILFWAMCVLAVVVGFGINFYIASGVEVPNIKSDYLMHSGIAALASALVYIIVGFVVSKIFPNAKVGTWF